MPTKKLQILGNIGGGTPPVSAEDNGKVLTVVDGKWKAEELPKYSGETEVTPATTAQTLATAQKLMANDVTINPIPYYEVGNNSGGNTVHIGKEVE